MKNPSDFQPPNGLEPGIKIAGLVEPYQSGALPQDFPKRLERPGRPAASPGTNSPMPAASTRSASTGGGPRRTARSPSSPTATATTPS